MNLQFQAQFQAALELTGFRISPLAVAVQAVCVWTTYPSCKLQAIFSQTEVM